MLHTQSSRPPLLPQKPSCNHLAWTIHGILEYCPYLYLQPQNYKALSHLMHEFLPESMFLFNFSF